MNEKMKDIFDIDMAIENGYIKVYYQPVIRTINGSLVGMEALARWDDPVRGLISPAEFIPVLEENKTITKLDLHILHEICVQMRKTEEAGRTIVPVSFNLSRIDFVQCNIFEEIEKIIKEFNIPRDLINIEITESMIIEEPEVLHNAITRFRSAGYQVWMDDFGSGYSSLNVLQDYDFDEIKLDMVFMRKFNEKSKKIVRSIISMAKKIGVKTLAEGVETAEQFEFLKEIGCERVQGYYFSKPQPKETIRDLMDAKGIPTETRGWRKYFDKVGDIDFLTDKTLSILEYDGKNYKLLFINDATRELLKKLGRENTDEIFANVINSEKSPVSRQFRNFHRDLDEGGEYGEMYYTIDGDYMRLHAKCLCRYQGYSVYINELTSLVDRQRDEEVDRRDFVCRTLYNIFDNIYTVDMSKRKIEKFIVAGTKTPVVTDDLYDNVNKNYDGLAETFIHKDDRMAFLKFLHPDSLLERISRESKGYITAFFRSKYMDTYVWKVHAIFYVPERNTVIYTTRRLPLLKGDLLERLAPDYVSQLKEKNFFGMTHHLMDSRTINLFWKDKDRRFLGANQKFLETYGIKDVSEIIGKTDEDMKWHVDNQPYKEDEEKVLREAPSSGIASASASFTVYRTISWQPRSLSTMTAR